MQTAMRLQKTARLPLDKLGMPLEADCSSPSAHAAILIM